MSLLQGLGFQIKEAYPIAFCKCVAFIAWLHMRLHFYVTSRHSCVGLESFALIRYNVHILKDPMERMIAYDTFAWNRDNYPVSGKSICFPTL